MQKKSGIMKSGLDAMPLFLVDDLLKGPKDNLVSKYINPMYRLIIFINSLVYTFIR